MLTIVAQPSVLAGIQTITNSDENRQDLSFSSGSHPKSVLQVGQNVVSSSLNFLNTHFLQTDQNIYDNEQHESIECLQVSSESTSTAYKQDLLRKPKCQENVTIWNHPDALDNNSVQL